jgi:tetratricopeptide (TPR) repeat protein
MIGVGIVLAWFLWQVSSKNEARAALGLAIVLVLAVLTVNQNRQWSSAEALWTRASATAPNSRLGRLAIGALAEERHDAATALDQYESILRTHPDVVDALNDSALLSGRIGRWPEAVRKFERIVELTPDKAIAHFNLSFAYAVQRRYLEAAREQRVAIELDPNGSRADEWRSRLAQLENAMSAAKTTANPG